MAHKRLVDIYPFVDGNGRTARLLMNLILVTAGYGVVSIPPVWRNDYINALSASRCLNDMEPFSKLIAECVIESSQSTISGYVNEVSQQHNEPLIALSLQ